MPASPRNSVDLPAPFGPITATSAPGGDLAIEVMHRRMPVIAERDVLEFDLRGHAHLIASQYDGPQGGADRGRRAEPGCNRHAQDRPGGGLRRMRRRRAMGMGVAVVSRDRGSEREAWVNCYIITLRESTCGRWRRLARLGPVGWVERSDTHECRCRAIDGFRFALPILRQTHFRDLAALIARALLRFRPPERERAQGRPGARCTRGLVCNVRKENAHEHTGSAGASGLPCAVALRLIRALPGERLFCHRRP